MIVASFSIMDVNVLGRNGQLASEGHGIPGIDRKIHDHLFDLSGIDFHKARSGVEDRQQLNVFADQPA